MGHGASSATFCTTATRHTVSLGGSEDGWFRRVALCQIVSTWLLCGCVCSGTLRRVAEVSSFVIECVIDVRGIFTVPGGGVLIVAATHAL